MVLLLKECIGKHIEVIFDDGRQGGKRSDILIAVDNFFIYFENGDNIAIDKVFRWRLVK